MKKLLLAFLFSLLFFNLSTADELDKKIDQAKKICKELGFKEGSEKLADCALELIGMNNNEIIVQSDSENQYTSKKSNTHISTHSLSKKQKKKYKEYMAKPEIKLCINYINNYGWFDDQSVRWIAIQNREIDCNQYKDLARFEDEKRNRIAESGKKLLDITADGVNGTTESNSSKKRTHCRTTNVGGVVQVFCNEY